MDKSSRSVSLSDQVLADLLRELQPKIKGLLARYRIPVEDAEDLLHDVALGMIRRWEELRNPGGYLLSGVRHGCLMYWRSHRRRLYFAVDSSLLESVASADLGSSEQVALACDLERLLPQIPQRCRSVLRLRYALGLKPGEVAQQLGYRRSSISNVTSRCVAALSRRLVSEGYNQVRAHGRHAPHL